MKKRATSFLLAVLAVASLILPTFAAEGGWSAIRLDGEPVYSVDYEIRDGVCFVTVASFVTLMDADAMVEEENGRVSVSASRVTEVVDVDSESANVVTENLSLTARVGASYIEANGRCLYVEGGVITLNGAVAVPVRVMAQVYNMDVGFNSEQHSVILNHRPGVKLYYLLTDEAYYGSDNVLWLARIINAESGNQPLEGKIAVGNVVMNRVNNPQFPDTLYEVLFQKNQFSPASSGSIYKEPNWESKVAAMLVLEGVQVVPEALFFNAAGARSYAYKHRSYVTTIGDHDFYR